MRECIRCNSVMVENLQIGSNGTKIVKDNILKNPIGEIKCAVCPECGYAETYVENLEIIKELVSKENKLIKRK